MMRSSSLFLKFVTIIALQVVGAIGDGHDNIFLSATQQKNIDETTTLAQMLEWTELLTNQSSLLWEWEWTLIRINNVGGLENADFFTKADTQIVVTALNATDVPADDVHFHGDELPSKFTFDVQKSTNRPKWYEIGMVAYKKDTVSEIEIAVIEVDVGRNDEIINVTIDLAPVYDKWMDYSFDIIDYSLNVSLWRSTTPIFSETDQRNMNLTEILFDLRDGSVASLVYYHNHQNTTTHSTTNNNDKAVLYLPGRADSFAHPHVLQMYYEELGYDLYSLDPRYCGRTRRFMNESTFQYGHSIGNFDTYSEEMDLTLQYIYNTKNYTKLLAHCHSTGGLIALNYAMSIMEAEKEDPFDGYILNGPFLDWGHIGYMEEMLLENAGILENWIGMETAITAEGLSLFHTKTWILNRYNTTWRPIIELHLTTEWAQAATNVQSKILAKTLENPVTDKPVLLIASLGDNVLETAESEEMMPHVSSNYSQVILTYNSHDVTYSATSALNDEAIREISQWVVSNINNVSDESVDTEFGMNETTAPTPTNDKDEESRLPLEMPNRTKPPAETSDGPGEKPTGTEGADPPPTDLEEETPDDSRGTGPLLLKTTAILCSVLLFLVATY